MNGSKFNGKIAITHHSDIPDYADIECGLYISDSKKNIPSRPLKSKGGIIYSHEGQLMYHSYNGDILPITNKKIDINKKIKIVDTNNPKFISLGFEIPDTENYNINLGYDICCKKYKGKESLILGRRNLRNIEEGDNNILSGNDIATLLRRSERNIINGNNILSGVCYETDYNILSGNNLLSHASCVGKNILYGNNILSESENVEYLTCIGNSIYTKGKGRHSILIGNEIAENIDSEMFIYNNFIGNKIAKDCKDTLFSNTNIYGNNNFENAKGNILQCTSIGENNFKNLDASVLCYGLIALGNDIGENSVNIKDMIIIGNNTAKKIYGENAIIQGNNSLLGMEGSLGDDIIIGNFAGNNRHYSNIINEESKHFFMGFKAGSWDLPEKVKNVNLMGIGTEAAFNCDMDDSLCIGTYSGKNSKGKNNIFIGNKIQNNIGNENNYIGKNISCKGNKNTIITNSKDTSLIYDIDNSIILNTVLKNTKNSILLASDFSSDDIKNSILFGMNSFNIFLNINDICGIGINSCNKSNIQKLTLYGNNTGNESTLEESCILGNNSCNYSIIKKSSIFGDDTCIGSDIENSYVSNSIVIDKKIKNSTIINSNHIQENEVKDTIIIQDFLKITEDKIKIGENIFSFKGENLTYNNNILNATEKKIIEKELKDDTNLFDLEISSYHCELKILGTNFYIGKEFFVNIDTQKIEMIQDKKINNNVIINIEDGKFIFKLDKNYTGKIKILLNFLRI